MDLEIWEESDNFEFVVSRNLCKKGLWGQVGSVVRLKVATASPVSERYLKPQNLFYSSADLPEILYGQYWWTLDNINQLWAEADTFSVYESPGKAIKIGMHVTDTIQQILSSYNPSRTCIHI